MGPRPYIRQYRLKFNYGTNEPHGNYCSPTENKREKRSTSSNGRFSAVSSVLVNLALYYQYGRGHVNNVPPQQVLEMIGMNARSHTHRSTHERTDIETS